jgi:hypothetical protein
VDQRLGVGNLYLLAEWARTSEAAELFVFRSGLAEAAWSTGRHTAYYRFERTDRPEEERTLDPFRSIRPHLENSILGITRWSIQTAGYRIRARLGPLSFEPLVEVAYAAVADRPGGIFRAVDWYGANDLWSVSAGIRFGIGPTHRMGRYGVRDSHEGMRMP